MAKYDLETLLADIEALMVSNLNTKLAALDTEKADSITLRTIASGAYFFQEMNSKEANYNPFILYAIEDVQNQASPGGVVKNVTVQVALVLSDTGEDTAPNLVKRMLRYQRALEEVFQDNFQLVRSGVKLKVQSLMPASFQGLNSSELYRVVGVNVTASIA